MGLVTECPRTQADRFLTPDAVVSYNERCDQRKKFVRGRASGAYDLEPLQVVIPTKDKYGALHLVTTSEQYAKILIFLIDLVNRCLFGNERKISYTPIDDTVNAIDPENLSVTLDFGKCRKWTWTFMRVCQQTWESAFCIVNKINLKQVFQSFTIDN
jgi:hypothetical protein